MAFYDDVIRKLRAKGSLSENDTVLVVCGGPYDVLSLRAAGVTQAVVSNLDEEYEGYCEPFEWRYLDAEDLDVPDGSFDWVIEHAGLHHCASPHRALIEMYRVARKGVLAIEARDSLVMRTAVRFGLTSDYEIESVALHPQRLGGLRHTGIPNHIYRWQEREIVKTIESAHPERKNEFEFFYGIRLPTKRLTMASPILKASAAAAGIIAKGIFSLVKNQGNQFGFAIYKGQELKPWIAATENGHILDPDYKLGFDPSKYKRNNWSDQVKETA